MIIFKLDKIVSCRVLIASNQERGKVFSEQMRLPSRFLKGGVNLAALVYSIFFLSFWVISLFWHLSGLIGISI